jgi:hypothetical protein
MMCEKAALVSFTFYSSTVFATPRVYLIDKLKISEVGDKREYRIYQNSIGDREIFSDKI